ncbi:PREDICTED: uncharacterized protein LOC106911992 isoform X3 [Poecilia mexicana]|uniref:uncharacterized protein LOC106911992 isoform X3 n=1 Tax=Poecilia mexicana TaxID=48701 RepID=UPI00072E1305|nr:PREDICTED: uncharacterized protein LOC106911992 isoform X3 [Poecilia mexicana]
MRILQEVRDIERSRQLVIREKRHNKKKQNPIKTNMEFKWGEVFNFISEGQRQTLGRYAVKFSIHAGDLFYGALPERRAIQSKEEAWNLFKEFHASPMGGHTGIVKTRIAMCSRFYWPGMTADIEKWVSQCDRCQRVGPPLQVVRELQCIKVSGVWELIGIDLTGPMPLTSCGNQYILTATDYFSKWVEAFPLKTKTAEEVCQKLCSIFYRHGCREFVNTMNCRLCDLLSIQRSITAAYHPQTNGLDEKTNDSIKRALRKLVNDKQDDWDMFLEATLFSLRSKTHTTTKYSPFFLMYGREARFPSEVPVDMPLSSVVLPEDYSQIIKDRDNRQGDTKIQVEENVELAQRKMKKAFANRAQKKFKNFKFTEGEEVLLFNIRKRGRKGARMEADYSGPYFIHKVIGSTVMLKTMAGKVLKTKHSMSHLKPYNRGNEGQNAGEGFISGEKLNERETVIRYAGKAETPLQTKTDGQVHGKVIQCFSLLSPSRPQSPPAKFSRLSPPNPPVKSPPPVTSSSPPPVTSPSPPPVTSPSNPTKLSQLSPSAHSRMCQSPIQQQVVQLWSLKDSGQVEALVGPYKLYDTSFRTLCGHGWLSDEVIDAYLYVTLQKTKIPVYRMDAVIASSVFHLGQYRAVQKMVLPEASIWMCPVNVGGHWLLVIVVMNHQELVVIDPMGNETMYDRKLLRNWRNFLKAKGAGRRSWSVRHMPHMLQKDSSSCGVLVLKFAETYVQMGGLQSVQTGPKDISQARLHIATTLYQHRDKVEEYCVECNMLHCNASENIIDMIQCDCCSRWTHKECATDMGDMFKCKKCNLN